ncbi:MAG TPA: BON domain-containing protein, partial [Pyrinomonadaceae bacterium]|nr:BON domain-containing protein [Pyrinomonadaceae bacterium]
SGGSGGSGGYNQGRGGSGSGSYGHSSNRGTGYGGRDYEDNRGYGYNTGRFENDYDEDRDYSYGNEGYSDDAAGYGSTYNQGYGRGSERSSGRNYGGGYYGQGSESGFNRDYDRNRGTGRGEERGWFEKAADEVASWFEGDESGRSEGYRGRGTRNYQRSDSRISEDVNDRLTDDYYLDASDIEVSVENGEVTLTGTVSSRSAKRYAEDLAESVSGVKHLQNNLRVKESGNTGYNTGTTASTALTGAGSNTSTTGSTEMTGTTDTNTTTGTTSGRAAGKSKSAGGSS